MSQAKFHPRLLWQGTYRQKNWASYSQRCKRCSSRLVRSSTGLYTRFRLSYRLFWRSIRACRPTCQSLPWRERPSRPSGPLLTLFLYKSVKRPMKGSEPVLTKKRARFLNRSKALNTSVKGVHTGPVPLLSAGSRVILLPDRSTSSAIGECYPVHPPWWKTNDLSTAELQICHPGSTVVSNSAKIV